MVGYTFTISVQRCTEVKMGTLKKTKQQKETQTGILSSVI